MGMFLRTFRLSCWLKQDLFHVLARWAPSKNVEGLFFFLEQRRKVFLDLLNVCLLALFSL